MAELDQAWVVITDYIMSGAGCRQDAPLRAAVAVLCDNSMHKVLDEWFLVTVRQRVASDISLRFWSNFESPIPEDRVVSTVSESLERLHRELMELQSCLVRLSEVESLVAGIVEKGENVAQGPGKSELLLIYCGVVFYNTPKSFDDAMNSFFSRSIRAFNARGAADVSGSCDMNVTPVGTEDDFDALTCPGCDNDTECCQCREIFSTFGKLVAQLNDLGVFERIAAEPVMRLLHSRIEQHVAEKCRGNFDVRYLETLRDWLGTGIVAWIDELFRSAFTSSSGRPTTPGGRPTTPGGRPTTPGGSIVPVADQSHFDRLYHFTCEAYGRIRISQLFNIIVEFPESQPALYDLAECMEKVDLRSTLVSSLRSALETRLLHPGVNTADILTAFIAAIPALRILDHSGVLLDLVCAPVRKYLRAREDTVRCIVSSLTEDGNGDLSDELTRGQPLMLDDSFVGDDCTPPDADWQNWTPDPVDADPSVAGRSGGGSGQLDIISMLVNIYGSKELFINEYRNILANRILSQFSYETDREVRYLELLKLRFGETHLHNCEVMLKDVADSRRINSHITEARKRSSSVQNGDAVSVSAMILSAQFWPPKLREEKVQLPACLDEALERYTRSYELLKGNRTLGWKPHLGLVTLDVELPGKTLTFNVSPVHATIIWHYQDRSRWTVEELSEVMQMPSQALQRKLAFWQSQGLLREESTDTYVLVEDHKGIIGGCGTDAITLDEEDETESALVSAHDQKEEELQLVWSYVVGMLTNLESLPIDRIHSMLKMVTMNGPGSQCTLVELKALLDRKVREQKLLYTNGVYRLVKQ